MCGICGVVDFSGSPDSASVEEMTRRLLHRGPDMGGIHAFRSCVLGHRRLSILDLSEGAAQPMVSDDGNTAVVFNGEIYNFEDIRGRFESRGRRFRTRSDTEVLPALYFDKRDRMVEELNGMFAFAIWDDMEKRLFLARDRLGKKPLYYFVSGRKLVFSSELHSLLGHPEVSHRISDQALFEYLLYDFIPAPHTIFEGVYKLPAAHTAVFDAAGLRVRRYWDLPEPEAGLDYEQAKAGLEELLFDAVRIRLISDVPLGAFLSGGVDSTLVTAIMKKIGADPVKTFSVSFPGTTYDESPWSRLAASSLKTDHQEYPAAYDVEAVLPKLVRRFGEPFGDSSALPTWHLSKHTREHVTVALSGDGGDELFGGYDRYLARKLQLWYDLLPAVLRESIIEPILERLPTTTAYYGTSLTKKLKLFVRAARRHREDSGAVVPRTFSYSEVRELTGLDYVQDADPVLSAGRKSIGGDAVAHMLLTDIRTYMAEDILTKVDRMSMAHSLEVRSPLLDYRVVERACRFPLDFKISGLRGKRILKDVAANHIPREIISRSKYGFQVPLGEWLNHELKDWASSRLLDGGHGRFRPRFVERLRADHQNGKEDNAHKLWLLIVFDEWYHEIIRGRTVGLRG
ncbi:MAG: asparagine synthase (glutamine-hydrolyzing) [Pseudomonadota bacterium]